MNIFLKFVFPCLIPILTITYGVGDHLQWWDKLSGRHSALIGWERLIHGNGYPENYIYKDESEFIHLEKVINKNTTNKKIIKLIESKIRPTAISIDGGGAKKHKVPEDWPQTLFIPENSQILYLYSVAEESAPRKLSWVGSASDLRRWIAESKNTERFWVTTVLFSILSIWVGIFTLLKK